MHFSSLLIGVTDPVFIAIDGGVRVEDGSLGRWRPANCRTGFELGTAAEVEKSVTGFYRSRQFWFSTLLRPLRVATDDLMFDFNGTNAENRDPQIRQGANTARENAIGTRIS
jgi:hypothetical protein